MPKKTRKIRILGIFTYFYPHRGGSQKYAEELYARLLKDYPGQIDIDILCYNTDKKVSYEVYRGMRIYRIPCFNIIYGRFSLPNPYFLLRSLYRISKNKYTHVNTHIRFFDPTWWVWLYAKFIGAKSIFTGHVAMHPRYENKLVEIVARVVDLTFAKFSLRKYDYLTFTNKAVIKFFKQKFGVKKKPTLVYGGVNTEFFYPLRQQNHVIPKINKKLNRNDILVTFIGRVTWTKGVTYLLDSIKSVYRGYKKNNLYFLIAGPGDLLDELRYEVRKFDLEDKVFLPGDLDYSQVRNVLQISDIFINPSHHNEGFPNTILEAGVCGCFVIATNNAGTQEVVKHMKTGLLVPQKDAKVYAKAVLWAVGNPTKRRKMAREMRFRLTENHDWGVITKKFYKILIK